MLGIVKAICYNAFQLVKRYKTHAHEPSADRAHNYTSEGNRVTS